MNTRFIYLYRDGSNYKNHGEIILRGRFTLDHINRIRRALFDGENFIAQSLGIPSVAHWSGTEFPANEDDHPFHEFDNLMLTAREATHPDTVEEMVKKMEWASQEGWKHEDVNPHPLLNEYRAICKLEWISWQKFLDTRSKETRAKA